MYRRPTLFLCAAFLFLAANLSGSASTQKAADPPASITPDAVRRTKQATVMLKVTGDGRSAEGSGFFAVEPGIVVTNAHVLGMLQASSKPPTKVEVIVNSGTPTELKLQGKVLGVDRASDIAVLKVDGVLTPPLQFGKTEDLVETQKVYIFGFPFGSELGRNITVSESSVSSLRTDARGELTQIQVNGGMHPGNSGGPVVNTQGQVVGVSVAVIRNTQINFAIPGHTVKELLNGGILDVKAGEPFREKAEVRVPLQYNCLDPLQKIREVRVEVWAGRPEEKRAFSPKAAQPQPGDGPRQNASLKYAKGTATGDVLLPALQPGQVAWVQPVVTFTKGAPVWGEPRAFDPSLPVERVAVSLNAKLAEQKERTVQLKSTQSATITKGKNKFTMAQSAEVAMLETFAPHPKGAAVSIAFGAPKLSFVEDAKKASLSTEIPNLVQRIPPRFVVDETNQLRERADTSLPLRTPPAVREMVMDYMTQICNGYEATNFIIPNRTLQPRETWAVKTPMMLKSGVKADVADLMMTCALEGIRTTAGNAEALVTFDGTVRSRPSSREKLDGRVTGKFTFDIKRGFISSVKMTISSEASSPVGDLQMQMAFDIELTRVEGNPSKLLMPKSDAVGQGAVVRKDPPGVAPIAKKNEAGGNFPFKGLFTKPEPSKKATSYLKVVSTAGDPVGQGKNYDFAGDKLDVRLSQRGITVEVAGGAATDRWHLEVGAPENLFLKVGEYPNAKRHGFSGDSPGLDFSGNGRGSNTLTGAFAVWELVIRDGKVAKLAIDFEQHTDGKPAGLTGKLRINSSLE